MAEIKNGYYVFNKGKRGHKPRKLHPTLGEALVEARRLAENHHGIKFQILELAGQVVCHNGEFYFDHPVKGEKA